MREAFDDENSDYWECGQDSSSYKGRSTFVTLWCQDSFGQNTYKNLSTFIRISTHLSTFFWAVSKGLELFDTFHERTIIQLSFALQLIRWLLLLVLLDSGHYKNKSVSVSSQKDHLSSTVFAELSAVCLSIDRWASSSSSSSPSSSSSSLPTSSSSSLSSLLSALKFHSNESFTGLRWLRHFRLFPRSPNPKAHIHIIHTGSCWPSEWHLKRSGSIFFFSEENYFLRMSEKVTLGPLDSWLHQYLSWPYIRELNHTTQEYTPHYTRIYTMPYTRLYRASTAGSSQRSQLTITSILQESIHYALCI